jgi:hypothetical protein
LLILANDPRASVAAGQLATIEQARTFANLPDPIMCPCKTTASC